MNSVLPKPQLLPQAPANSLALAQEYAITRVASAAVRSIFLNCTQKLTSPTSCAQTIEDIARVVALCTPQAPIESLLEVCEGSTRLCVCMSEENRMGALSQMCAPLLEYVRAGVQTTAALCIQTSSMRRNSMGGGGIQPSMSSSSEAGKMESTMQQLARGLKALGTVVKFLDGCPANNDGVHPLTELLNVMWPLLQQVTNYSPCRQHEDVLRELLLVHERIVGSFGDSPIIETKLGELINTVILR